MYLDEGVSLFDVADLSDAMVVDHVIQVHEGGGFTHPSGVWAPSVLDEKTDDERWSLVTGYSMQWMYPGPIMHDSEGIHRRLGERILTTPGYYAAVVAMWSPDPDMGGEEFIQGWAVVYRAA